MIPVVGAGARDMTGEIALPTDVFGAHDTSLNQIKQYLVKHGYMEEEEQLVEIDIHISNEEAVTITNYRTERIVV